MGKEDAWKEFERTGAIGAYMKYRSTVQSAKEKEKNTPEQTASGTLRGAAEERRMGFGNHGSPGDHHPGG